MKIPQPVAQFLRRDRSVGQLLLRHTAGRQFFRRHRLCGQFWACHSAVFQFCGREGIVRNRANRRLINQIFQRCKLPGNGLPLNSRNCGSADTLRACCSRFHGIQLLLQRVEVIPQLIGNALDLAADRLLIFRLRRGIRMIAQTLRRRKGKILKFYQFIGHCSALLYFN